MIQFLINNNFTVPRFCYHGLLSIAGNCRVCVIDDKEIKTSVSCSMCYEVYITETFNNNAIVGVYIKSALYIRENIFEFLLLSHPLDCPICDRGGECELQDMTNSFGSDRGRNFDIKSSIKDKILNMTISTHMTRCITCGRCVRFLREIVNNFTIGIVGRGNMCEIGSYVSNYSSIYNIFLSNIIDLCPVCYNGNIYKAVFLINSVDNYNCNINIKNINYYYGLQKYYDFNLVLNYKNMDIKYIHEGINKYNIVYSNIYLLNLYVELLLPSFFYTGIIEDIYYSKLFRLRLYYSLPVHYLSRNLLNDVYECVLCASCTASCPSYWWNGGIYLGPAVLLQSYRWIVDSKDSDILNRLELYDIGYNISLCHAIGNCEIVCPKNLNPADRISDIKSLMGYRLNILYYSD